LLERGAVGVFGRVATGEVLCDLLEIRGYRPKPLVDDH
jgi:hypothetical protein